MQEDNKKKECPYDPWDGCHLQKECTRLETFLCQVKGLNFWKLWKRTKPTDSK